MAKVFTQEEREKIKGQVVELVRQSGRETLRQLEVKTGATRYLMSVSRKRAGCQRRCMQLWLRVIPV